MSLNPLNYLKESRAELEKVVWPTRIEAIRLTVVVIIISVIVGAYIAGLDAVFAKLTETFLR
jgi:preprotein translocase subunit SecE